MQGGRSPTETTHADRRARTDASLKGYKTMLQTALAEARQKAAEIIKNTYRTLMTRSQKGCFVFSVDPETNDYSRQSIFEQAITGGSVP